MIELAASQSTSGAPVADHKELSLSFIVTEAMSQRSKVYEPLPSTREMSVREMRFGPRHIKHRFPFKGGVSIADIIASNVSQGNALLTMLTNRRLYGDEHV